VLTCAAVFRQFLIYSAFGLARLSARNEFMKNRRTAKIYEIKDTIGIYQLERNNNIYSSSALFLTWRKRSI